VVVVLMMVLVLEVLALTKEVHPLRSSSSPSSSASTAGGEMNEKHEQIINNYGYTNLGDKLMLLLTVFANKTKKS
jgi:hypothetical protein